ncbi:hypothetical protein MMC09_006131 [Bachmanniomyces sp. S44760]|nr:hypothetical protein [Bachmanniomyces sp. S44760]
MTKLIQLRLAAVDGLLVIEQRDREGRPPPLGAAGTEIETANYKSLIGAKDLIMRRAILRVEIVEYGTGHRVWVDMFRDTRLQLLFWWYCHRRQRMCRDVVFLVGNCELQGLDTAESVGIGDMYRIDMLDRIQYRNMIQKGNPNPNLACIKITIVDLQNRTVGLQLARRDEKLGVVLNAYYRLIRSDPTRGIIMFDDDPVKEYHTPYLGQDVRNQLVVTANLIPASIQDEPPPQASKLLTVVA